MTAVEAVLWAVATLNFATGAWGSWCWYRVAPSRRWWVLLRAAQAALVGQALVVGAFVAAGHQPRDGLFYVYSLVPLAVSFAAEQLRVAAAETVLDARDLPSAQAVGELPEVAQRMVVLEILRRELGVMALAALVAAGLLVRGALTAAGL